MVQRVENKWAELREDLRVIRPVSGDTLMAALKARVAETKREAELRGHSLDDFSGSFPAGLMSEKIREIAEDLGIDTSKLGTTEHIHRTAKANFPWTMGSNSTAERIKAYLESVATERRRGKPEGQR